MSTVSSLNTFWRIRGIESEIELIQDSQGMDALQDSIGKAFDLSDYGSAFVLARDGEILNVWACDTHIALGFSHCDHVYSAVMLHKLIRRNMACAQAKRRKAV